jgi:hypothetical protein
MIIIIGIDELEKEYQQAWRMKWIKHPCIDYATNSIHAWFEKKEVIIFKFKDYGFINDNRTNTYNMSVGEAGIMIQIVKT